jgi:hypothetical protein
MVIGDGGWAKRSYGHGYNSQSGVVIQFLYQVYTLHKIPIQIYYSRNISLL